MPFKCFLLTPINKVKFELRRYTSSAKGPVVCPLHPGPYSYHDASAFLTIADIPVPPMGEYESIREGVEKPSPEDPRWPKTCDCGYEFTEEDEWQLFSERMNVRSDGGDPCTIRQAPPGALWYAWWLPKNFCWDNMEGFYLMAKTPGGEWCIDGRASNCTMPQDRFHRCWVRHGEVPDIHVDKNGRTCAAGAGSIVSGNYHGFLHNGYFTDGC